MIDRATYLERIRTALARSPIVMLMGPRQCGKTTLAQQLVDVGSPNYFDLEDHAMETFLANPSIALKDLRGLVVLDEAQRMPTLFPALRVLADRNDVDTKFLLLGSASPELSRQASESLAGRVEFIEIRGFGLDEVGVSHTDELWLRGGFPRSFLAKTDEDSMVWRDAFLSTFLERDLANLGFGSSPQAMRRFWTMLSHYHGQLWNASEIARSLGVSAPTANRYLDALEQTFMARRLQPWHLNTGKRLVKSPKVYIRDTGLLHTLQGIAGRKELWGHPKLGASWEGFAMEEVLSAFRPREAWFYAVHSGAELDLFFLHGGQRIGVEFKRADAPQVTKSMHVAMEDLQLDHLLVVYPGERQAKLAEKIEALPLSQAWKYAERKPSKK